MTSKPFQKPEYIKYFQKSFLLLISPEPHKSVSILARYFLHFTNKEYKPRDMKYLAESNAVSQAFRNGNQSDYFGSGTFWTAPNEFCFTLVETRALHLRLLDWIKPTVVWESFS